MIGFVTFSFIRYTWIHYLFYQNLLRCKIIQFIYLIIVNDMTNYNCLIVLQLEWDRVNAVQRNLPFLRVELLLMSGLVVLGTVGGAYLTRVIVFFAIYSSASPVRFTRHSNTEPFLNTSIQRVSNLLSNFLQYHCLEREENKGVQIKWIGPHGKASLWPDQTTHSDVCKQTRVSLDMQC